MNSDAAVKRYYGIANIRKSLRHFFIGKGFKILSSLALLALLARLLSREDYAVYVSLQALVALGGVVGSLGIQAVLFRYLPELRAEGNNRCMYRLLLLGSCARFAAMAALAMLGIAFLEPLVELFGLSQWLWLVPWFFAVGIIHNTNLSISQSLESLLWQQIAQYSLAAGSLVKLAGVAACALTDTLSLPMVVAVEGCAELVIMVILVIGWWRRFRSDSARDAGEARWWRTHGRRVMRYGGWSFLLSQTLLLYGSAPNRLLAAHALPAPEVAILGVADSLANLGRRFMPTRLLINFIRPVMIARYSTGGGFDEMVQIANLVYRLNLYLLALPMALLLVVGEPVFAWLTAGKYGTAALLLAGFLLVLIAESMRSLLEILVQAVEHNEIFLITNLVQSASLLLALMLLDNVGVWALIIANLSGTVLANLLVVRLLSRKDWRFRLDLWPVLLVMIYAAAAGVVGEVVLRAGGNPWLAGAAIVTCYGALSLLKLPFDGRERGLIGRVISGKQEVNA